MSKTAVLVCVALSACVSAFAYVLTPALTLGALAPLAACDQFPDDASSASTSTGATSGGAVASDTSPDGSTVRVSMDANTLCTRLINECGQVLVLAECIKTYASLRVAPSCMAGIGSATCADLTDSSSAVLTTCFPPCAGTLAACNGDGTITTCTTDGQQQVVDCNGSCIAQGFTGWTQTCGVSYQGQTAAAPQCWCQ